MWETCTHGYRRAIRAALEDGVLLLYKVIHAQGLIRVHGIDFRLYIPENLMHWIGAFCESENLVERRYAGARVRKLKRCRMSQLFDRVMSSLCRYAYGSYSVVLTHNPEFAVGPRSNSL